MNSIRQSIAESTFSNWSGQTWPRDEKESWQVHEQFHWTLQSGVIMEWVVTQKTVPPSEFGHGSCGSFKTESVWSSGRTVRPSVRPFQWLARVELVFMSTTVQSGLISFGPSVHGPYQWLARVALVITTTTDQFHPTRKEGRAQILQKPAQGHENFQQPWSSRRLSNMKTFRHEDFQTWRHSSMKTSKCDDQHQRRLPFYPKILQQEDLQTNLHPFLP